MMRIGENGILQNFTVQIHHNGTIAEIVDGLKLHTAQSSDFKVHTGLMYKVKPTFLGWNGDRIIFIEKHNIRPLTDPDAQKETEREKELIE